MASATRAARTGRRAALPCTEKFPHPSQCPESAQQHRVGEGSLPRGTKLLQLRGHAGALRLQLSASVAMPCPYRANHRGALRAPPPTPDSGGVALAARLRPSPHAVSTSSRTWSRLARTSRSAARRSADAPATRRPRVGSKRPIAPALRSRRIGRPSRSRSDRLVVGPRPRDRASSIALRRGGPRSGAGGDGGRPARRAARQGRGTPTTPRRSPAGAGRRETRWQAGTSRRRRALATAGRRRSCRPPDARPTRPPVGGAAPERGAVPRAGPRLPRVVLRHRPRERAHSRERARRPRGRAGRGRPGGGLDHPESQVLHAFIEGGARGCSADVWTLARASPPALHVHGHFGRERRRQLRQGVGGIEPFDGEVVLREVSGVRGHDAVTDDVLDVFHLFHLDVHALLARYGLDELDRVPAIGAPGAEAL